HWNSEKGFIDLSFPWGQFQEETKLQPLLKRVEKYPSACARWLWGTKALVLIYDPDYMKVVLGRSDPKSHNSYRMLIPWIVVPLIQSPQPTHTPICGPGKGLLLLERQTWFQHRWMLTPAFHYDLLKPYVGVMADSVRVMLDKWEGLINPDSHLEILGHVSLMTLDTIMKCAFGHQGSIQTDSDISWTLYALASHPEHQQRCREEIQSLLGDGASITWSVPNRWENLAPSASGEPLVVRPHLPLDGLPFRDPLDQMPYITICIKEALRLYPPVPFIFRDLSKPITFPVGPSLPASMNFTHTH
ncbi:hypothetical protein EI555_010611, partial [Monodon monoceros]